jgi:hypothetical protein
MLRFGGLHVKTLEQSIDRLYTSFADVPKPLRIDGCPCCIEKKNIGVLLSSPLRELTPDDLSAYAASAFLTFGTVADYLYFLPRILEISIRISDWWPDIEVTGRAIAATEPPSWSRSHYSALLCFLHAVIDWIVASGEHCQLDGWQLDGWLCAIARMGLDIHPFLGQVAKSPVAILAYFEVNAKCLPQNALCNSFWELPCEGHDAIVRWFQSEPIRKIPLEAYGYVM